MLFVPVAKTSAAGFVTLSMSNTRSRRFSQVASSGGKVFRFGLPDTLRTFSSGMNEMNRMSTMLLFDTSKSSSFLSLDIDDGKCVNRLLDRNNSYKYKVDLDFVDDCVRT